MDDKAPLTVPIPGGTGLPPNDKPVNTGKSRNVLLNYKESKDIFEVKFTKEIDRQLSARPPTGEELNPDKSK